MIYALVVVKPETEFNLTYRRRKPRVRQTGDCEPHVLALRWNRPGEKRGYSSTQNLGLLRTCKWVWREAASVLYGQTFIANTEVMACFLSHLRPWLLRMLRGVRPCYFDRFTSHWLNDVMQRLLQATSLRKLDIHPLGLFFARNILLPDADAQTSNQAWFLTSVDFFNTQLGRTFAFCLYGNYLGRWMAEVYRSGGIDKLSRILVVKECQVRYLWSYALGEPVHGEYSTPRSIMFWRQNMVWSLFNETRCEMFRHALFAELDNLLSRRLRREESTGASHAERRTILPGWKAVDIVISIDEAEYLIKMP